MLMRSHGVTEEMSLCSVLPRLFPPAMRRRSRGADAGWCAEEFKGGAFPDQRIQKRFLRVSAQLAAQPQASIPQACEDWTATKAAYRLFENPRVEPARVILLL
jgi:hypothetical protein